MDSRIARRSLLVQAGTAGLGWLAAGLARAADVLPTPRQPEGPFYPVKDQADKDVDLTRIAGRSGTALGTVLLLDGTVRTLDGAPIPGALVEIWQACASGRYNHPGDENAAPLDPNFQGWGRVTTGASGAYRFKSIKPGAYPNSPDWMRPPHIHVRVIAPGFPSLTTQLYFEGEDLNARDHILRRLSPAERKLVISAFNPVPGNPDQIAGRFDIVVARRAAHGATPELD